MGIDDAIYVFIGCVALSILIYIALWVRDIGEAIINYIRYLESKEYDEFRQVS